MRYVGVAGQGRGTIYIGKGKVVGIDSTGARHDGSYTGKWAPLVGDVTPTSSGSTLVTGLQVPSGT